MNREDYNEPISLRNVHITDNFWKNEMELVRKEIIPYQWDALNDRVEGPAQVFACGISRWQESRTRSVKKKEVPLKNQSTHSVGLRLCRRTRIIWKINFTVLYSRTAISINGSRR